MSVQSAVETLRDSSREGAVPMSGLEAVVAGALSVLPADAWWVPGLREHGGAVLREGPEERLADPHQGARPYKIAPVSAAPALRALHAVGLARASGGPALVHLGIGSVADGAFSEALNLAALLSAPVIFLVAELPLTDAAPLGPQTAASATALAKAYDIPSFSADGSDPVSVARAVEEALGRGGPAVISATLPTPGASS